MTEPLAIVLVILSTIAAALGSFFLKKGSMNFSRNIKKMIRNKNLVCGGILYVLGLLFVISSLKFGNLSLVYPFVSLTYVWVAILSARYMKEKMGKIKIIGLLFIILGVIFVVL